HDRAHGHRQHAGDGLVDLQRLPSALRQHRGGVAGGPRGRDAVPRALPGRVPAVLPDVRPEHGRRGGAAPPAPEVPLPMKRFWASGEPFIWLTGGALSVSLLMVVGLIGLIVVNGLGFFWPASVVQLTLKDGKVLTGPIVAREAIHGKPGQYAIKIKVGNRDLYGFDFVWVVEADIANRTHPPDLAVMVPKGGGTPIRKRWA